MSTARFFTLLSPLVAILFGCIMVLSWAVWHRRYLLTFGFAFFAFAAGSLTQILSFPMDAGANALISTAYYLLAATLLIEAYLARIGRPPGRWLTGSIAALIFVLTAYFFYVDRNLLARIYVLNFGLGVFFVASAIRIGSPAGRPVLDHFLFWEILAFGIQFFVRTALTTTLDLKTATLREFSVSPFWIALNFTLIFFTVAIGVTLFAAIAFDVIADLRRDTETDPLTNIANRRGFERTAESRIAAGEKVSLVLIDLDRFKLINDRYGHPAGDRVLGVLAAQLRAAAGPRDVIARLGGEEFAALLVGSDSDAAHRWAETLRLAIRVADFGIADTMISASFGVAEHDGDTPLWALLETADQRLYIAKRGGRDRVVSEGAGEVVAPAGATEPARAAITVPTKTGKI